MKDVMVEKCQLISERSLITVALCIVMMKVEMIPTWQVQNTNTREVSQVLCVGRHIHTLVTQLESGTSSKKKPVLGRFIFLIMPALLGTVVWQHAFRSI